MSKEKKNEKDFGCCEGVEAEAMGSCFSPNEGKRDHGSMFRKMKEACCARYSKEPPAGRDEQKQGRR